MKYILITAAALGLIILSAIAMIAIMENIIIKHLEKEKNEKKDSDEE